MINIDFLVAGCNTRCKHCYVRGGPGPLMPLPDALLCLERLDSLSAALPDEVTFTLDHEPMNHPHIAQILHAASQTRHIRHFHHGMTTGLALMRRADRAQVVHAYMDCGCRHFGVTLHGGAALHDAITRREGACRAAVAAAEFFRAQGAQVEVSLMVNRFFPRDAEEITALLNRLAPDFIYFAVPIFTPHSAMMDFEPYRATTETLESLRGRLAQWGQDEGDILWRGRQSTAAAVALRLNAGETLRAWFAEEQEEVYLSLHPDCRLYVGNSGAETRCLGDLRDMDLTAAAERIRQLPGNRDYGAFYAPDALPTERELLAALKRLPRDAVYGDFPSAVYRGLSELKVPTRIIF